MTKSFMDEKSAVTRIRERRGAIGLVALLLIFTACSRTPPATARPCLQFSADLMPDLASGLNRNDFRVANAWAVKSDQTIDSSGVKLPAYFLSADVIAPNGEAVVATWATTAIAKPGLIWSVSPQAKKYTRWAVVGDSATKAVTMETPGAKESISCVLTSRGSAPRAGVTPSTTKP